MNGMSLSKEEFEDGLIMQYGIGLDDLPKNTMDVGQNFGQTCSYLQKGGISCWEARRTQG